MSNPGGYRLLDDSQDETVLQLTGDWLQGAEGPEVRALRRDIGGQVGGRLIVDGSELGQWDSRLPALLLASALFIAPQTALAANCGNTKIDRAGEK